MKKKPFGGYKICFENCNETVEQIFGKGEINPAQMIKMLWRYIKKYNLGGLD